MTTPDQLRARAHACRQQARTADAHEATRLEKIGAACEVRAEQLETGDEAGPEAWPPLPAAA